MLNLSILLGMRKKAKAIPVVAASEWGVTGSRICVGAVYGVIVHGQVHVTVKGRAIAIVDSSVLWDWNVNRWYLAPNSKY